MRRQHHGQRLGPGLLVTVVADRGAQRQAGIVDDDVERAECLRDLVDDLDDLIALGDIERPGFCAAAARLDLVGNGLRALRRRDR